MACSLFAVVWNFPLKTNILVYCVIVLLCNSSVTHFFSGNTPSRIDNDITGSNLIMTEGAFYMYIVENICL